MDLLLVPLLSGKSVIKSLAQFLFSLFFLLYNDLAVSGYCFCLWLVQSSSVRSASLIFRRRSFLTIFDRVWTCAPRPEACLLTLESRPAYAWTSAPHPYEAPGIAPEFPWLQHQVTQFLVRAPWDRIRSGWTEMTSACWEDCRWLIFLGLFSAISLCLGRYGALGISVESFVVEEYIYICR